MPDLITTKPTPDSFIAHMEANYPHFCTMFDPAAMVAAATETAQSFSTQPWVVLAFMLNEQNEVVVGQGRATQGGVGSSVEQLMGVDLRNSFETAYNQAGGYQP